MQLNWVYLCGATPDDATESVTSHSSRLQPSIICLPQLQPWYSAALVTIFTTRESGMKAQVNLETKIEPNELVYYLGLEPALHGRKANVLPLDQLFQLKVNTTYFCIFNLKVMDAVASTRGMDGPDPSLMFRPQLRSVQTHWKMVYCIGMSVPCMYIATFYCSPAKRNCSDPYLGDWRCLCMGQLNVDTNRIS